MTTPTDKALAVRAALESGGGAAETQLALLASEGGDSQLQLVVEKLTAAEINVIVADADMSKPSMAHAYITPEQFMEALSGSGLAGLNPTRSSLPMTTQKFRATWRISSAR
jgi:hypothetical protein